MANNLGDKVWRARYLTGGPEWQSLGEAALKRLKSRFYDRELARAIKCGSFREHHPQADALAFAVVWMCIENGEIAVTAKDIGTEPKADRCAVENAAALKAGLPDCEIVVTSGNGDCDGWIKPPDADRFQLEIGDTTAATTWLHLALEGARLARWPYGSTNVFFFVGTKAFEARLFGQCAR